MHAVGVMTEKATNNKNVTRQLEFENRSQLISESVSINTIRILTNNEKMTSELFNIQDPLWSHGFTGSS